LVESTIKIRNNCPVSLLNEYQLPRPGGPGDGINQ
jgi:hypothetical protein